MAVATRARISKKKAASMEDRRAVMAKMLTHPLRLQILKLIDEGEKPMSPSMLAEQLQAPLGNVSYHVRQLLGAKFITLKRTKQRRGAVEHFYALEEKGTDLLKLIADW
jgi:DNA-binding transcriptional ArsR family regulator